MNDYFSRYDELIAFRILIHHQVRRRPNRPTPTVTKVWEKSLRKDALAWYNEQAGAGMVAAFKDFVWHFRVMGLVAYLHFNAQYNEGLDYADSARKPDRDANPYDDYTHPLEQDAWDAGYIFGLRTQKQK